MNKRGLSHIEVVLGFVIFMIAVVFLISSYTPLFKEKPVDEEIVKVTYEKILDRISAKGFEADVFLNRQNITSEGKNTLLLNLSENITNLGVITREGLELNIIEQNEGIICISLVLGYENFQKILALEGFDSSENEALTCLKNETLYKISNIHKYETGLESKIEIFNESYYEEYDSLKSALNLPSNFDFEYEIEFNGKEYIGEKESSKISNVYSLSREIKVLLNNGQETGGEINLKVW